ncbi:hypothetical protein [Halioglobus sp. HI00S01]|nr:hypothetical protein [Halioglobus sp. HI00S01]
MAKPSKKNKQAAPPPAEIMRLANIMNLRSQVYEHTEWMGYKAA